MFSTNKIILATLTLGFITVPAIQAGAQEVKTLIEKTGLYSKWDTNTDGKVSNAEFEIGTFNAYDDNGDGNLNLEEWKSVLR